MRLNHKALHRAGVLLLLLAAACFIFGWQSEVERGRRTAERSQQARPGWHTDATLSYSDLKGSSDAMARNFGPVGAWYAQALHGWEDFTPTTKLVLSIGTISLIAAIGCLIYLNRFES